MVKREKLASASTQLEKVIDRVRSECNEILVATMSESPVATTSQFGGRRRHPAGVSSSHSADVVASEGKI